MAANDKDGSKSLAPLSKEMQPQKKKQKLSKSLSKVDDVGEAMKNQNDVAMFLAGKVISALATDSNFVFSPASITAVLTMTAATSTEESLRSLILSFLCSSSTDELNAVFSKIATVVFADGSSSGGPRISAVNGVWVEQSLGVDHSAKDLIETFFKASFTLVDFQSKAEKVRKEVNSWASKHTNGLIRNLLPSGSVSKDTKKIYGNALYFKGVWDKKFHKSMTKHQKFHLVNGRSVEVLFMSSYEDQYITAYDGFKVLRLPYRQGGNNEFSMYMYLPDVQEGFNSLLESMTSTHGFLDSHIPEYRVRVGKFKIPKFKIKFGFEASTAFPELVLDVSLYHKAMVEIDEEGTEAAAATALVHGLGCIRRRPPKLIDFVADHPFLYLIREDITGTVLFAGQIFDPSKSD